MKIPTPHRELVRRQQLQARRSAVVAKHAEAELTKRQAEADAALAKSFAGEKELVDVRDLEEIVRHLKLGTEALKKITSERDALKATNANIAWALELMMNQSKELTDKLERIESGDPAVTKAWKRETLAKMDAVRQEVKWYRERFAANGPLAKRGVAAPQLRVVSIAKNEGAVPVTGSNGPATKFVQYTMLVETNAEDAEVLETAVKEDGYFATVPASTASKAALGNGRIIKTVHMTKNTDGSYTAITREANDQ